ncbi:MAG: SOS response-associated peptidase [Candidatus Dormibacteraceae bacterium]
MCGRFVQQLSAAELAQVFGAVAAVEDPGGHFNVAPTQPVMVVVDDGERRVVTAHRWGLIPRWADNPRVGSRLINARAETVGEKPAFRSAFRHQRCLIPADGFYEWRQTPRGKVPHAIVQRDGQPLALAGLWSTWTDPATGETVRSCAIITTTANAAMAPIHDRMPVILPRDTWDVWLDPKTTDVDLLQALLQPCPAEILRVYPVSPRVNNVRHDAADLLDPSDETPDE